MAIETYVNAYGDWRKAKQIYVNQGGTWVNCKEVWIKNGGTWKQVFSRNFVLNLTISGYDFNLQQAAYDNGWDGSTPVDATVTVSGLLTASQQRSIDWNTYLAQNQDLIYGSGGANQVGVAPVPFAQWHYLWLGGPYENRQLTYTPYTIPFTTGTFPSGSTITLIVNAGSAIIGAGGAGGYGGILIQGYNYPTYGSPGSPAMNIQYPITIINNGVIAGGGGGGAGGGGDWINRNSQLKYYTDDPGSGGGGGGGFGAAGQSWRPQYNAQNGSQYSGGSAGTLSYQGSGEWNAASVGGNGGDVGNPGANCTHPGRSSANGTWPTDFYGAEQVIKGGTAGAAALGSSQINWQVYGDVRGPLQ